MRLKSKKLSEGGMEISYTKRPKMTFADFVQLANSSKQNFGDGPDSIKKAEDMHWSSACLSSKMYAMNNNISLFSDEVSIWNLDSFTLRESSIHFENTHHTMPVSFNYFSTFALFYFFSIIAYLFSSS